jgi:hypothetical protein
VGSYRSSGEDSLWKELFLIWHILVEREHTAYTLAVPVAGTKDWSISYFIGWVCGCTWWPKLSVVETALGFSNSSEIRFTRLFSP